MRKLVKGAMIQERKLTPEVFDAAEVSCITTLGAKARGFRFSICCRVSITISLCSTRFKHPWHEQESLQYAPAAKQSQYLQTVQEEELKLVETVRQKLKLTISSTLISCSYSACSHHFRVFFYCRVQKDALCN